MDKNKSMFPITETTERGIVTRGGATIREEAAIRITCAMLQNPNYELDKVYPLDVVEFVDDLFEKLEQ